MTKGSGGWLERVETGASGAGLCRVPCGLADGTDEGGAGGTHVSQKAEKGGVVGDSVYLGRGERRVECLRRAGVCGAEIAIVGNGPTLIGR